MQQIEAQSLISLSADGEESFITGLNHDYVRAVYGQNTYIDAGRDMELETSLPIAMLVVTVVNDADPVNQYESFSIDSRDGRITSSDKLNPGSIISIDGIAIGVIPDNSSQSALQINFNANATADQVQELIRSLSYINTAEDYQISSSRVWLRIKQDGGGWDNAFIDINTASEDKIVFSPIADVFQGTAESDIFYAPAASLGFGDALDGGGRR